MDVYDVTQLPAERAVVFVAATTGQVGRICSPRSRFLALLMSIGEMIPLKTTQHVRAGRRSWQYGIVLEISTAQKPSAGLIERLGIRSLWAWGLGCALLDRVCSRSIPCLPVTRLFLRWRSC
jgi:hypothetical protein